MRLEWRVVESDDGRRAVDVLEAGLGLSRTLCKRIRMGGALLCNDTPIRMVDRVRTGDLLVVSLEPPPIVTRDDYEEQRLALFLRFEEDGGRVVYRDENLCVLDKPASWISHPTGGHLHGTASDYVRALVGVNRVHIVNRLDRGTSGLMIVALDPFSHNALSRQSRAGECIREYLGIVHGQPVQSEGCIDAPIAKDGDEQVQRIVHPDGQAARTDYSTERTLTLEMPDGQATLSLVRFRLQTGRTHQIRVHCRHIGYPLVGDTLYGLAWGQMPSTPQSRILDTMIGRQALHADRLLFRHPVTGARMDLRSDLASDMAYILASASRS